MIAKIAAVLVVVWLVVPGIAGAGIIVVEPDLYPADTDLSDVSPFVSIRSLAPSGAEAQQLPEQQQFPVFATPKLGVYEAPTGQLTFGRFGYTFFAPGDTIVSYQGLGFLFHQPVSEIWLLAQNDVEGFWPLAAEWTAFDQHGGAIASGWTTGGTGGKPGEVFSVEINLPEIRSLVIGASDGSAVMTFDELRFRVSVSEPASLALLGLGLVGLMAARRCRRES
jgi:hypothetical protein